MQMRKINWGFIMVLLVSLAFWACVIGSCVAVTGCKSTVITIPRRNLKPVKIVDQRALWDTRAKDMYVYVDPNMVHIEVGQVRSVSDANSIKATGTLVGEAAKTFIRP
jgi:hypothetical protein